MKYVFSTTLALALLASVPALAGGGGDKIDVMTQNQYLGADLNPIIAAPDPIAFNQALIDALEQIAANNFPARARKLAQLIAFRRPDLVGLQEVFAFSCIDLGPPTPGAGCDDRSIKGAFNDHLTLTLKALRHLGKRYDAKAQVQNLNITLPVDLEGDGTTPDILVTVLDRDVILARKDVAGSVTPVPYSSFCARPSDDEGPGCNYSLVATANTALGPIAIERGWVGVDATIGGKDYRFVNTHLEVQRPDGTVPSSVIQAAQAGELIATLAASTPPSQSLIVVGDINSSPEDPIIPGPLPLPPPFNDGIIPPYTQFVGSGYTDVWDLKRYPTPGFTCCQDADLLNKRSKLDERIDVIFSAEPPTRANSVYRLGATFFSKTWPGRLWPSDHASVAAELQF